MENKIPDNIKIPWINLDMPDNPTMEQAIVKMIIRIKKLFPKSECKKEKK